MRGRSGAAVFRQHCPSCSWRDNLFFCHLEGVALQDLERIGFRAVYPTGSILYAEGEEPRGVFLLCNGAVKLSVTAGDGKRLITRLLRGGEILGLSSVLTGNVYKATAETTEPTAVNFIRREDFLRILANDRGLSANTVRQLSVECEAEAEHVRTLGLAHSAAEKLARLLLTWCTEHGRPAQNGIRVPLLMTHAEISEIIGTSRETVSRLLKHFRSRGLLSVQGATLTVHKKTELESLAP